MGHARLPELHRSSAASPGIPARVPLPVRSAVCCLARCAVTGERSSLWGDKLSTYRIRFDAGAGDSDLVWMVLAGLNYRFEKADLAFGYRHMAWEFDDNDTFEDLDMSGPYLGLRVHF